MSIATVQTQDSDGRIIIQSFQFDRKPQVINDVIEGRLLDWVIDLSNYNTIYNSQKIWDYGIRGIIHKVTDGISEHIPNDNYRIRRYNWLSEDKLLDTINVGLVKTNILVKPLWGAYHFLQESYTAKEQVSTYLKYIKKAINLDPINGESIDTSLLAVDWEANVSVKKVEDFVKGIYDSEGRYPFIYTGLGEPNVYKVNDYSVLWNCPVWWANYMNYRQGSKTPEIPNKILLRDWTFWQHLGDAFPKLGIPAGECDGVSGNVDRNFWWYNSGKNTQLEIFNYFKRVWVNKENDIFKTEQY